MSFDNDEALAAIARSPLGLTRSEIAIVTGYCVYRPLAKLAAAGAVRLTKVDGVRRWQVPRPTKAAR